ncbi:orotate phosphoribosyltransferase [Streptomyces sp. DH8]|uniref:orotate phosphoribosyltransferase n=1 Tax=Streptomyces sp. DH8 TaxID=2857008 RepID=UPI001E4B7A73|nr:phosphoribosyltransferase family protein [Streptomyces sp. DH8]
MITGSAAEAAELADLVAGTAPFVEGRRADGRLLANYFDGHRVLGAPAALDRIATAMARRIQRTGVAFVAGEAAAGSGLAVAVSLASVRTGRTLSARTLRRTAKTYGVPGVLSTPAPPRSRFAVVDDVAGTGAALERSVERLHELGHEVVGAWVIVDRQDGATQRLLSRGVELTSLLTLGDIRTMMTIRTPERP